MANSNYKYQNVDLYDYLYGKELSVNDHWPRIELYDYNYKNISNLDSYLAFREPYSGDPWLKSIEIPGYKRNGAAVTVLDPGTFVHAGLIGPLTYYYSCPGPENIYHNYGTASETTVNDSDPNKNSIIWTYKIQRDSANRIEIVRKSGGWSTSGSYTIALTLANSQHLKRLLVTVGSAGAGGSGGNWNTSGGGGNAGTEWIGILNLEKLTDYDLYVEVGAGGRGGWGEHDGYAGINSSVWFVEKNYGGKRAVITVRGGYGGLYNGGYVYPEDKARWSFSYMGLDNPEGDFYWTLIPQNEEDQKKYYGGFGGFPDNCGDFFEHRSLPTTSKNVTSTAQYQYYIGWGDHRAGYSTWPRGGGGAASYDNVGGDGGINSQSTHCDGSDAKYTTTTAGTIRTYTSYGAGGGGAAYGYYSRNGRGGNGGAGLFRIFSWY